MNFVVPAIAWACFILGVLLASLASMALTSWILNGLNDASSTCQDDEGVKTGHKRAAWSTSFAVFAVVGCGALIILTGLGLLLI